MRSGAKNEQWDDVVLFHELTTESIRMLLPVSMFEVSERLASFKGALLLGLRADFGGDPSHLEVALTDAPNRAGQGRRRYLMLFDSVPGGTGYLARLAEPDRVRTILERGRDVIARCPCVTEGRQACHRCLLGVVDRNEYELARRDLALEILDDLLGAWEPQSVASVAEIEIGKVEESELERRFKAALRAWAAIVADAHLADRRARPGSLQGDRAADGDRRRSGDQRSHALPDRGAGGPGHLAQRAARLFDPPPGHPPPTSPCSSTGSSFMPRPR
ncbi:MAG: DUF1998 domain-containing protein [Candidatus Microthrix sp.]|nr:DUF1998 domain-containing protein [Candidatus Microthrix sp.]